MSDYRIAVIGLWHLGETYSAGLSELGHAVVGISDDPAVVANFSKNIPPLPEPQLEDLLARNQKAGRLRYSTDYAEVKKCNVVWFTFDTPVNDDDEVDLSPIWNALDKCLPHLQDGVLIVMTSQIPVGTSKELVELVKKKRPDIRFDYAYTPENLRLSEAVKCFMEPGRIVVGADSETAFRKMTEIFAALKTEIVRMTVATAEMTKHALNAFLATSVSFINDIADVCERSGADVLDVAYALRADARIGKKAFLDAGLGFSGGTLGRDLKALMAFAKRNKMRVPVVEAAFEKNKDREALVVKRLTEALKDLSGKQMTILGLTYKPGTRTLRRSRALGIAAELAGKGVALRLSDPVVQEAELPKISKATFVRDLYAAAEGSDVFILVTPWPEFKDIDFKKLAGAMKKGAIVFDTANLLRDQKGAIEKLGLRYFGVGR
ncbi:MAG TPA: nucleotide sugar dehydrogenase [Candidatus Paceibacterota bacterium]|nr:nucleotide sugar dehydrogenase [Candidatus Paceibacterota bacterium]